MAGGRKLTRLRILTPEQCSKLRQRGITTGEVDTLYWEEGKLPLSLSLSLSLSPSLSPSPLSLPPPSLSQEFISANVLELMAALSLSHNQLHTFTQALSHSIAPQPKNVSVFVE